MNSQTRQRVKARISEKMNDILNRRLRELKSDRENLVMANPFGSRLVPQEIWKGSKFERSFVTSFGQGVYEQIAYEIAVGSGAQAENQHSETVVLTTWQDEAINNLLTEQRGNREPDAPNWENERESITRLSNPAKVEAEIRFDLYIKRQDNTEEYYSLKTVKPNLDQTEIAKRDMLRVSAAKPSAMAFLALPYNPYGESNQYRWSIPNKLFNMNESSAVLIGAEFWNSVGNSPTVYDELLEIFDEVGEEYKKRITEEYLHAE